MTNKSFFTKCSVMVLASALIFNLSYGLVFAQQTTEAEAEEILRKTEQALREQERENAARQAEAEEIQRKTYEALQQQQQQTANTQGGTYVSGETTPTTNASGDAGAGVAGGVGNCAAGIVAGAISGFVGNALGSLTNTDKYTMVQTTSSSDDAHSGGSTGWPPSKDSIAYCIVNTMIEYFANATIDWINTGFNGNPAFVENPEQFFSDIADQTTAGFLQEVVGKTTGLDICQPFRLEIATGLGAGQGAGGSNPFACTLGTIGMNLQNFQAYTSGASPQSGNLTAFYNISQNPQNNLYGAYFMAQKELQRRVTIRDNTAKLDLTMGNGFLSFKKCEPDTTVNENGKDVKKKGACKTTTPGTVIEDQLNSRLKLGSDRLVLAEKFDQVVSALASALIKTALSSVLGDGTATGQ